MIGHKLHVQQGESPLPHSFDKRDQGDFGGVGYAMEHGLAEEGAADGNAVQSARELIPHPRFHAMPVARLMQSTIGVVDILGYPSPIRTLGTGLDHLDECTIDREGECAA